MKIQKIKQQAFGLLLAFVCAITILFPQTLAEAAVVEPSGLKAHHAYAVIDARTGELLLGDRQDELLYPASTTKLMTAIVLIENSENDRVVTVTSDMIAAVPFGISKYGMRSGQSYTMEVLLHMILMSSAGDAAVCAAMDVFGSVEACVDAMNAKAEEFGLVNTYFDNTVGLDIGDNYNEIHSTAYEVACLTRYAMSYEKIADIVKKTTYTVNQSNGTTGKKLTNTNSFYTTEAYSTDLYTIIGSKTGTTNAAGYVFAATAIDADGREVICAYMGKKSKVQTFADIRKILDAVYTAQKDKEISLSTGKKLIKTEVAAELETTYEKGKKIKLGAYLIDSRSEVRLSDFEGTLTYKSTDKSVATVSSKGTVTVKGVGTAVIIIKSKKSTYYEATEKTIEIHVIEA